LPTLLQISSSPEYNENTDSDICKGAVTLLRQHIGERWEEENEISQNDKQIIRDNIVESMTKCTDLTVMESLEDCMHIIAVEDYPENWPNVLVQVGENLTAESPQVWYASLCALKAIIKKYQSKIGKERKPLLEITENAFDILEGQFEKHLTNFDQSSVLIMTVLTKIFYYANYVVLYP